MKWYEIQPKHIIVSWDMGKEGEKPRVQLFLNFNGKVYSLGRFYDNSSSINIGDIVEKFMQWYEKEEKRKNLKDEIEGEMAWLKSQIEKENKNDKQRKTKKT